MKVEKQQKTSISQQGIHALVGNE